MSQLLKLRRSISFRKPEHTSNLMQKRSDDLQPNDLRSLKIYY